MWHLHICELNRTCTHAQIHTDTPTHIRIHAHTQRDKHAAQRIFINFWNNCLQTDDLHATGKAQTHTHTHTLTLIVVAACDRWAMWIHSFTRALTWRALRDARVELWSPKKKCNCTQSECAAAWESVCGCTCMYVSVCVYLYICKCVCALMSQVSSWAIYLLFIPATSFASAWVFLRRRKVCYEISLLGI